MPSYNAESYISLAIESILNQTFSDFELIIIDDGSTDNTLKEIEKFQDERIKCITFNENKGNYVARNKGVREARANYIAMLDADDVAKSDYLEVQYRYLKSHPKIGCVGALSEIINAKGIVVGAIPRPLQYSTVQAYCLKNNPCTQSTMMFRKKLIIKNKLFFNEKLKYSADYDFVARAVKLFPIVNVDRVLIQYRVHSTQISSAKSNEQAHFADQIRIAQLNTFDVCYSREELSTYLKLMKNETLTEEELILTCNFFNILMESNSVLKFYNRKKLYIFFEELLMKTSRYLQN